MQVRFNAKKHSYTLLDDSGKKISELTSVTTLLAKHGLAPNYTGVSEDVLHAKAERGTVVHNELERYIKKKKSGFTCELELFIVECQARNIVPTKSEFIVHNNEIAGKVDISGAIDNLSFIGEIKTTAALNREYVAWQLSLYAYLSGSEWDKLICFHFPDEHTLKIIELEPIDKKEIERLLECERNFILYHRKTIELDYTISEKILAIQSELKCLTAQRQNLEKQERLLKEYLVAKMEETGVKSIDNELFKINYVDSFTQTRVDSAKLKREQPKLYEQYSKTTVVGPGVRITLKE